MAEREGFEPSVPVKIHTLSRRAPSATRPPLRLIKFGEIYPFLDGMSSINKPFDFGLYCLIFYMKIPAVAGFRIFIFCCGQLQSIIMVCPWQLYDCDNSNRIYFKFLSTGFGGVR